MGISFRERVIEAGRRACLFDAYVKPVYFDSDSVDTAALAGARAALEDLEAVYVAWLRLEEADEKGHWQTVQVALNGVRSRLADLSPSPAVKRADDELLRIAKDFVVLANTIWDNSPDGARAKELSEERMGNLARRIMEWPAHEGPSPPVEPTAKAYARCDGRYPVPQTAPPRDEPFEVTYRCALPQGPSPFVEPTAPPKKG